MLFLRRLRRSGSTARTATVVAAILVTAAGCATTTIEETVDDDISIGTDTPASDNAENEGTTDDGQDSEDAPDPDASTPDVLERIGVDMSRLSETIIGDGDGDALFERIDAAWISVEDDVARADPNLATSIQATVDMARTAVVRNRPADADKAFSLFASLIDDRG